MLNKKMIRLTIIIFISIYLLFLAGGPIFMAALHWVNRGPESKKSAIKNGKALVEASKTVIAVGAHPDDIEWYAGATLAKLSKDGGQVIIVMATDDGRRKKTRQDEQMKAAHILGYEKVIFLGYPDGLLKEQPEQEIVGKLEKIYSKYKPDTIITFDPDIQAPLYHHSDHFTIGKLAVRAASPEDIPHVYLFHSGASDTWVDISKEIKLKAEAREAHRSQTKRYLTPFGMSYIIREVAFIDGLKVGLAYAESFRKFR